MGIWFVILLIAEIVIFLLYIYLWKRYPVLGMPFDFQYRVFRRAYRAYKPVRNGKMLYHVYAADFLAPYKHTLEGKQASSQNYKAANRIVTIIEERQEFFESYFQKSFGYTEYLAMMSEYDLTEKEKQEEQRRAKINAVPLLRKVLIFESLFRAAGVDTDTTQKARFIRNLLEIELETDKIANTNIYKQLKKAKNAPETEKERQARADDLEYVVNELEYIDLQKEKSKLINETKEYKDSVL